MWRRISISVLSLVVVLMALGAGIGCWLSAPGHRGPPSDHFDGKVFINLEPTELAGPRHMLRMLREGSGTAWADRTYPAQPPPPVRVEGSAMRVTFVNHATTLVQHDSMNVLTDPIWSERCSAVQWVGPKRHHAPGTAFDDLPPIDVVLISHNHYDHLDLDTLKALALRDDPVLIVPLGNGALVAKLGFSKVVELDWGETTEVGPLKIIGQRVRHFSGRGIFDRQRTLWMGFVVDAPAGRWVFAGDTGYGDHFAATGAEWGPFRLALLPIGAYEPRWFMAPIHMDPAEAVQAHQDLRARQSVGVHFGTFKLTQEGQDDPPRDLAIALHQQGIPSDHFVALSPGQGLDIAP